MFGKKKQKQETLVRMRNLAQLDEGFFAHMKDGKDMFDATAREIRETYQQLGAGITQIQGNIKEASQMAASALFFPMTVLPAPDMTPAVRSAPAPFLRCLLPLRKIRITNSLMKNGQTKCI